MIPIHAARSMTANPMSMAIGGAAVFRLVIRNQEDVIRREAVIALRQDFPNAAAVVHGILERAKALVVAVDPDQDGPFAGLARHKTPQDGEVRSRSLRSLE
jgi:hypothetical protein